MVGNFENKLVEVCGGCFRASCYYSEFMCDKCCGTVLKTIKELRRMGLEHEDYWSDKKMEALYGDVAPYGYMVDNVVLTKK